MPEDVPRVQRQAPTLNIVMKPDGGVMVGGPLANKGLCYGMLVQAMFAIYEYQPPIIKTPDTIVPGGFDGRN